MRSGSWQAEVQRRTRRHLERKRSTTLVEPAPPRATAQVVDRPVGSSMAPAPPPFENPFENFAPFEPWPAATAWGVLLAVACAWGVVGLLARALDTTALAALGQVALAVAIALGFGIALRKAERLGDRR